METKVVELTVGKEGLARQLYPDGEIELRNPYNYVGAKLPYEDGELDGIFTHFILTNIAYRHTQMVVDDWARCLKTGGLLHVIVPSFEWLMRAAREEVIPLHVRPLLFGTQHSQHHMAMNALTMLDLRVLFRQAGLTVIKARVQVFQVQISDESFQAEQHYVVGEKNETNTRD
jgi:predicted SAM-dependent methyltransferase